MKKIFVLIKKNIPQSLKNIYHLLQAAMANVLYGFPSRNLKVIGVTGTNGKTTTVQMIAKILEEAGNKIAVASTINFKIGEKEWINKTKFTTLSAFAVQKFIRQAIGAGCGYLVLETSSHSLDQYRVWGVKYEIAVITNVTREHLDYHKTMEEYRKAKLKLFKNARVAVVNLDMENPEKFMKYDAVKKYAYTICHSERSEESRVYLKSSKNTGSLDKLGMTDNVEMVKADDVELGIDCSKFKIQNSNFLLHLPGGFNIENALAATCVGISEDIKLETISKALEKIKSVPGRFEFVENARGLNIIVDYAVTPDSLEKLYGLIGEMRKHEFLNGNSASKNPKIIAVFGSCGERDRGKRPIMGEIVSKNADLVIITNEDPYGENPEEIIEEVAGGIILCDFEQSEAEPKNPDNIKGISRQARDGNFCFTENVNFWKIMDRREAIRKALSLASAGDFVVVTGKGAEETMAVGNKRIPWNDRRVIEEELQNS